MWSWTFSFFLSDSFTLVINKSTYLSKYYDNADFLQTFIRWGYYLNYTVLPMAIFFNSKLFKNIASYVCLTFSILSSIYFNDYMQYFLSQAGEGLHLVEWFRYSYFVLELVLAITIPTIMQIKHKHYIDLKNKKEVISFFVTIPLVALVLMPVYVPQSLFGLTTMLAVIGSPYHKGWIIISISIIICLYFIFRFKSYRTRYMLCVFLTIALFFNYNSLFLKGVTLPRLPIQLCNLAAYLYLIAIPFKRPKLFQFCFLANTAGAMVAYLAADFSGGAFAFWNVHFIYEHTLVLAVPVLAMWLRVFPRVEKKALLYTFVGFTIYFLFCLSIGTIINGLAGTKTVKVNYFFMFDLGKVFKYAPILRFAKDIFIKFGRFTIYPVIVSVIYLGFSLLYLLLYCLTRYLYKFEDEQLKLRRSAIDLYEKHTKKKSKAKLDFQD